MNQCKWRRDWTPSMRRARRAKRLRIRRANLIASYSIQGLRDSFSRLHKSSQRTVQGVWAKYRLKGNP